MLFTPVDQASQAPEDPRLTVFASGANRIAEMRGFSRLRMPFGVSASELSDRAVEHLTTLSLPVLVDSGAFSEVEFSAAGCRVVRPITDQEWRRRLRIYKRLALALGPNAYVVAPDRVGDQKETLRRLRCYRSEVQELAQIGAAILIPLQVGVMTHAEFWQAANDAAGLGMVPALPMKKEATDVTDLLAFVRETSPRQIHLLGIGATQRRGRELLKAIQNFVPEARVSMDSNRLRAVIGRSRPLTTAENRLREAEFEGVYGEVRSPVLDKTGDRMDYTDMIAFPSYWATQDMLAAIAGCLPSQHDRKAFLHDPDSFLQAPRGDTELSWGEDPFISAELDRQWSRYVSTTISTSVRTAAIVEVFGGSR